MPVLSSKIILLKKAGLYTKLGMVSTSVLYISRAFSQVLRLRSVFFEKKRRREVKSDKIGGMGGSIRETRKSCSRQCGYLL